jgi:hypothetical protein
LPDYQNASLRISAIKIVKVEEKKKKKKERKKRREKKTRYKGKEKNQFRLSHCISEMTNI